MGLVTVVATVIAIVLSMLLVATLLCIRRDQWATTIDEMPDRLNKAAPYVSLLVIVLLVNTAIRPFGPDISWLINLNITGTIYSIEGNFVVWLQQFVRPELTAYFSFIYIYGYVFLLVFPLLAYLALERQRYLQELTIAYAANYTIGLFGYLLFVAFGPRNLLPDLVQQPMYDFYPQMKLLTSAVNANTNVFPSLHTSLAATVMLFAWRTRVNYPRWVPIAMVIGASVIVSTMYLGIHWLIDVIAGIGLAYVSYLLGIHLAARWELSIPKPRWLAQHFGR